MSTTETKVRHTVKKIALSQTRYELFEVTHDDSLGREVLSRPLNIGEMRQVVAVYNSHADMLEALEKAKWALSANHRGEQDAVLEIVEAVILRAKGEKA